MQEDQFARLQPDACGLREATEGTDAEFVGPSTRLGIDYKVMNAEVFFVLVPSRIVVPRVVFHAHSLFAQRDGQIRFVRMPQRTGKDSMNSFRSAAYPVLQAIPS